MLDFILEAMVNQITQNKIMLKILSIIVFVGAPVISGEIEFELLSAHNAATPVFFLNCVSTDGPATTVVWTRDGDVVPNDSYHIFSQTVVNAQTAQYSNTLTVTGERPGNYQCSVSNDGNVENPAIQTLTVEGTLNIIVLIILNAYTSFLQLPTRQLTSVQYKMALLSQCLGPHQQQVPRPLGILSTTRILVTRAVW